MLAVDVLFGVVSVVVEAGCARASVISVVADAVVHAELFRALTHAGCAGARVDIEDPPRFADALTYSICTCIPNAKE